jgi:hypothetical protein
MIDTGRRFYPVELVESLLEGMAMMKMNVMHMFLSELCTVLVFRLLLTLEECYWDSCRCWG